MQSINPTAAIQLEKWYSVYDLRNSAIILVKAK